MSIAKSNKLRIVILMLSVLSIYSCSKEDIDLVNLDNTFMVRHKNADMPAYVHGNGSEKVFLIILHGGPGGQGLIYRSSTIRSEIEKEYAVVYFDQRGSGISQGSYSEDEINVDLMAEDVLALVKVIKQKYGSDSRFFLMGHSFGGAVGTAALLKDQNEFLGWIEVSGSHNAKGSYLEYIVNFERVAEEQIALGNSIDYWNSIKNLVLEVDRTQYNYNDFVKMNVETKEAERVLESDGIIAPPMSDIKLGITLKTNSAISGWNNGNIFSQLVIDQAVFGNLSFSDRLLEITIPSLVLWGRHDLVVSPKFAQEAFDNLGSNTKELVFFERSGHEPMFSEPGLFAGEVIRFMDENK